LATADHNNLLAAETENEKDIAREGFYRARLFLDFTAAEA
jgi:hypothetical protein